MALWLGRPLGAGGQSPARGAAHQCDPCPPPGSPDTSAVLRIIGQLAGFRNLCGRFKVLFSWYSNWGFCFVGFFKTKVNLRPVAVGRGEWEDTAGPFPLAQDLAVRLLQLVGLLAAACTLDKHIRAPRGNKFSSAYFLQGGRWPRACLPVMAVC